MEEKRFLDPSCDLYIVFGAERLDFFSKKYRERVLGFRLYLADPLAYLGNWRHTDNRLKWGYEVFSFYSSVSGGAVDLSYKIKCLPGLYSIETRALDPNGRRIEITKLEFLESVTFSVGSDSDELDEVLSN